MSIGEWHPGIDSGVPTGTGFRHVTSGSEDVASVELGVHINAAPSKTVPVDADTLGLSDSAALNVLKSLTWANLKTALNSALSFISSNQKAAASGVASLDTNTLVVQNPANATSTKTASKIPIADTNGLLDTWITPDFWCSSRIAFSLRATPVWQ